MSDGRIQTQTVGAIRLALEGAANDEAALGLVKWLVEQAPEDDPRDTESVALLIEGIKACGFSLAYTPDGSG